MGYTDEEISQPLVGVVNSANEIIPGHIHLDIITQDVKAGIRMAGGTPVEFPVIGVCDGIAMGHAGMKYSLASRELIADSVEIMATAHPFDALVYSQLRQNHSRHADGGAAPQHPLHIHQRRADVGGENGRQLLRPHQRFRRHRSFQSKK